MLGVFLARNGRPVLGLLIPSLLVLLPVTREANLADSVLLRSDPHAPIPAFWPYSEALLQLALVLVPIALALRGGGHRRARGRRASLGWAATTGVVTAVVWGMTDAYGFALGDRAAIGSSVSLGLVVVGTALLVGDDYRRGLAQVVSGAVAIIGLQQAGNGLLDVHVTAFVYWPDVLGYAVALFVGPAAMLASPFVSRAWVRTLRGSAPRTAPA